MVKVELESALVHQVIDLLQLVSQFAPAQNCKTSKSVVKKLKTALKESAPITQESNQDSQETGIQIRSKPCGQKFYGSRIAQQRHFQRKHKKIQITIDYKYVCTRCMQNYKSTLVFNRHKCKGTTELTVPPENKVIVVTKADLPQITTKCEDKIAEIVTHYAYPKRRKSV